MRRTVLAIVFCLSLFLPAAATVRAEEGGEMDNPMLDLANEFISLRVNAGGYDGGRISVDTTGGDPTRETDGDQPLVYGRPIPWTSFTTVRIDGQDYVFGGPTRRRSGRGGITGEVVSAPHIEGRFLVTTCRYGSVEVTQRLGFARSLTTRMEDTAEITYTIVNRDSFTRTVGLRLVLDTMVGANDGAPFRLKDRAVTGTTSLAGSEIPDYWLAFDSLTDPRVVAQGTLRGLRAVPPDLLTFTDWGTAADELWDMELTPGAPFLRKGEEELDSAVVLYWNPVSLLPGAERTVTTYYGLGGVDIQPGHLTLGITAPAEVQSGKDRQPSFLVLGYLENSGGFPARDVKAVLKLPEGLSFADDKGERDLGEVATGGARQMAWMVRPNDSSGGKQTITLEVSSANVEGNRVSRQISILAPPRLSLKVSDPGGQTIVDGKRSPDPLVVKAVLTNSGGSDANNVRLSLIPADDLKLVSGSLPIESMPFLAPGEKHEFAWNLSPAVRAEGPQHYRLLLQSTSVDKQEVSGFVDVPRLETRLFFRPQSFSIRNGAFFNLELALDRLRDFNASRVVIAYDPKAVEPVFISRGTLFADTDFAMEWVEPVMDEAAGTIVLQGSRKGRSFSQGEGGLGVLHFRALRPGQSRIVVREHQLLDGGGKEIVLPACGADISVE